MKRSAFVGLLFATIACGGTEPPPTTAEAPKAEPPPAPSAAETTAEPKPETTATTEAPAPEPAAPIASTPLAGNIEEKPFAVKTALGEKSPDDPAMVRVTVFDRQVACKDLNKPGPVGSRWVTVTVPWKKDSVALNSDNAGLGSDTKSGPKPQNIKSGRAEVVELPAKKGAKGKIRLKIVSAAGDSVEGEADVALCE